MKALLGSSGVQRTAVFALLLVTSGVCHADPPKPDDKYDQLLDRARRALKDESHEEAVSLLRAMNALRPNETGIVCNLGRVEFFRGNDREAATWLARCQPLLPQAGTEWELDFRRQVTLDLMTARQRLSVLAVDVDEPDTSVVIDNDALRTTPIREDVFVEPGEHRIQAFKGGRTAFATISTVAGKEYRVALALLPARPPASPTFIEMSPYRDPFRWWPVVLGGAFVGTGLAMGTAFTFASNDASNTAGDRFAEIQLEGKSCDKRPAQNGHRYGQYERYQSRSASYSTVSLASFIAAGAITAGVIGYAIYESRRVSVSANVGSIAMKYQW